MISGKRFTLLLMSMTLKHFQYLTKIMLALGDKILRAQLTADSQPRYQASNKPICQWSLRRMIMSSENLQLYLKVIHFQIFSFIDGNDLDIWFRSKLIELPKKWTKWGAANASVQTGEPKFRSVQNTARNYIQKPTFQSIGVQTSEKFKINLSSNFLT